jgi:hypothetical protein
MLPGVATLICIHQDLGCMWPDEEYVDEIYGHTASSSIVYMSSKQIYLEYTIILILYTTIMVL